MLPLYLNHKANVWVSQVDNADANSKQQAVAIKWKDIAKKIKKADPNKVVVRDAATNEIIPSTLNFNGKKPAVLTYNVNLSAGTSRFFEISSQ